MDKMILRKTNKPEEEELFIVPSGKVKIQLTTSSTKVTINKNKFLINETHQSVTIKFITDGIIDINILEKSTGKYRIKYLSKGKVTRSDWLEDKDSLQFSGYGGDILFFSTDGNLKNISAEIITETVSYLAINTDNKIYKLGILK